MPEPRDRDASAESIRRSRLIVRASIGILIVGCVAGIVVPAGINWDFGNFYDAGRRLLAGELQYLYLPRTPIRGLAPQSTQGFFGAPLSAFFYIPFAVLPAIPAMMLFKLQTALFNAAGLVLLYRHTRRFAAPGAEAQARFAAIFALASVIYQPLWTPFRTGGQTTGAVFFCLVLTAIAITQGRAMRAVVAFVLAVTIKPSLAIALVFFVLLAGWRYLRLAAIVGSAAALLSIATLGWQVHQNFLLFMIESLNHPAVWYYNSGLYTTFENLHWLAPAGSWPAEHVASLRQINTAVRVAVLALFMVVMWRSRAERLEANARNHFNFLMAIAFFCLTAQIIYEVYLSFLLIPLMYVMATKRLFSPMAGRLVTAIVALCLLQNIVWVDLFRHFVEMTTVPQLIAIGLFKSLPSLLLLWFIAVFGGELAHSHTDAWKEASA